MTRVLVVEDEDVLLNMLSALIQEMGCESLIATNGKEAMELLDPAHELPKLIIADIMMPQMSGIELTRQIRARQHLAQIPIILMSAGVQPPPMHRGDHFLQKPFRINQLADLIRHYIAP